MAIAQTLGTKGYFTGGLTAPTVIDELLAKGKTEGLSPQQIAGQFDENLNGPDRVNRHDGFEGFNSLAHSGLIHDLSEFGKGSYDNLPQVSFVTPYLLDDMHGTGKQTRDQLIAQSDAWIQKNLSTMHPLHKPALLRQSKTSSGLRHCRGKNRRRRSSCSLLLFCFE